MAEKKITKKDVLLALKEEVKDKETVGGLDIAAVMSYIDTTLEQLDNKTAKAREKAAAKKSEGDELRNAVQSVLTDELQTADAITEQIEGEDVTKSKIVSRLNQLVNAEVAHKEQVTVEGRRLMAYRLSLKTAAAVEETSDEE